MSKETEAIKLLADHVFRGVASENPVYAQILELIEPKPKAAEEK